MDLPISDVCDDVCRLLSEKGRVVVTAPPGAGKSTVLPLAVLDFLGGDGGRILMLEPRRIAARQVAERMASIKGEDVGESIGYRIRFETRVSARTRLEVLTEGILTRMLVDDPALEGVSVVIFDEFHERSLNSDLALALVLECRRLLRPDLGIVIMSATIDAEAICKALDASLVESEGRMFPVEIVRGSVEATPANVAETVARTVALAYREEEGDILAFLPGEADIMRCQALIGDTLAPAEICPLYGNLPQSAQKRAIAPSSPGCRRIVLATPVAETSLTIEGVRIVVDSGLCRRLVHDVRSGLDRLETVRISKDMATQRAGRAGRVSPGICHRLWNLATERNMAECRTPEILEADLSALCLSIAAWGENDPMSLPWLSAPPAANVRSAMSMLFLLGAVDSSGRITSHGKKLASLPCHPRIAQMLVSAAGAEGKSLAADVAALIEEKDPLSSEEAGASIELRLAELDRVRGGGSSSRVWKRIAMVSQQYRTFADGLGKGGGLCSGACSVGRLVALAYPERIAREIPGVPGRYMLASGESVVLSPGDELSAYGWLAVASMNARKGADGRVFLAAPLDPEDVRDMAVKYENVGWDSRRGCVVALSELRIGRLVLESKPLEGDISARVASAICEACRKEGASILDFSDEAGNLQRRVAFVASRHPELGLPDLSNETVLSEVEKWLPLYLGKARSRDELRKIDLVQALWGMLDYEQQKAVERLAPSHLEVPTGSRIRVDYRAGADAPVLKVRLQECFGMVETPRVDGGRLPVLMELLSPGFKPVQLTSDLCSFWENAYFEVRKELRRRYPRHYWPENPLEAEAVKGVRKKS